MKNWTVIKLLPPKLCDTGLKTEAVWTPYEHQVREEQEYMEMKVEWTLLLSADVPFQKSKFLPPHKQAQCNLWAGIQDVQGHLSVLHSYFAAPGTQQGLGHSNTAITELIQWK